MAVAAKAFSWLSTIEKEYDNCLVDLDLILNNLEIFDDSEVDTFSNKINILASLFAQVIHKAQTIFENNAKLEAQNINFKRELEESLTKNTVYQNEITELVKQVHCLQLKQYSLSTNDEESEIIIEKMCKDIEERFTIDASTAKVESRLKILEAENKDFREYILALQTELYGARLAAKYLDKELAGRIQQIQLLTRKMDGDKYDRMWSTLESEINIQRQKTVIKAVKGPGAVRKNREPPKEQHNIIRTVRILKKPEESLGMSVTGGREHGVPLLISEVYPGQPAGRSGQLHIGDAILTVDGVVLRDLTHQESVSLLSQTSEEVLLEVLFISHDDKEDKEEENDIKVSEDGYMYRLYNHPKVHGFSATNNE